MSFEDSMIINLLQSKYADEQNKAFVYLYEALYDQFSNYILKRGGQRVEVEDFLQEGLVVLYKLAGQDKLRNIQDVKSYLFIICKNLWVKSKSKHKTFEEIDDSIRSIGEEPTIVNHLLEAERERIIQVVLKTLGEECRKILVLFYYQGLSIKEILKQVNFASENSLKNKKVKCMKALRELVQSTPSLKKYLR
jgi:RNA polymerase sigma factor (sigma-70 family)